MDHFSRESLQKELAKHDSYTRTVTVRALGGDARQTGQLSEQQEVEYFDGGNPTTVKLVTTQLCSTGHLLGPDNPPQGTCYLCKAVLCSNEGCLTYCARCRRPVCSSHSHEFRDGEILCPRCRWRRWLRRIFW